MPQPAREGQSRGPGDRAAAVLRCALGIRGASGGWNWIERVVGEAREIWSARQASLVPFYRSGRSRRRARSIDRVATPSEGAPFGSSPAEIEGASPTACGPPPPSPLCRAGQLGTRTSQSGHRTERLAIVGRARARKVGERGEPTRAHPAQRRPGNGSRRVPCGQARRATPTYRRAVARPQ